MCRSATVFVAILVLGSGAGIGAAHLDPETAAAWDIYISATEHRIAGELGSPDGFLAMDFAPDRTVARRAVLTGDVVIEPMTSTGPKGEAIDVPGARVHHWRGAVLLPKMTVPRLLARLQEEVPPQEDVLQSRILERGPDWMRVSRKLQRKKI